MLFGYCHLEFTEIHKRFTASVMREYLKGYPKKGNGGKSRIQIT